MRVAMVGPFGLKPKGTMAVRALPLAKALAKRGHEVELILPPWSYPQDAGKTWDEDQVRVVNTTISPRAQIPMRLLASARAFRPDVVHIFKPKAYSGIVQWMLWQTRRVGGRAARIVLDADDWEGAGGWNDLEPYGRAQKRVFAWQEAWGFRHADAVTVASRALETIVWSLGVARDKVLYLPNGVSPLPVNGEARAFERTNAWDAPGAPPNRVRHELNLGSAPVILLYTRFFEFDVTRAIEILSRVFAQMPDAKLLLVGKGLFGQEQKFFEMATARGWRDRVVDVGWVEPGGLRPLFAASNVAIFPYDDTLVNRCKCSVKLIDLLANGVPVVAEAVGQIKEYIRHAESGILVAPNDVDTFAQEVIELLQDREKRGRLGECARATMAKDYDWGKLAEGVERVYAKSFSSSSSVGT